LAGDRVGGAADLVGRVGAALAVCDEQRGEAGRFGGGGGGSRDVDVAAAGLSRQNAVARSGDGGGAGVAVGVEVVVLVGGGDANHVGHARRIGQRARAVVAGGRDKDDSLTRGIVQSVGERGGIAGATERHQNDVRAVVGRPEDAGDDVGVGAGAVGAENLDGRNVRAGVGDAGHADVVVDAGRGDAGHLGAVAVRVGVRITADEALAADDLAGQVGVGRVDAGIEDGDRRRAANRDVAIRLVPGDLGKGPLLSVVRVVGRSGGAELHRLAGVGDGWIVLEGGDDLVALYRGNADDSGVDLGQVPNALAAVGGDRRGDRVVTRGRLERNDD
jgi:hypothetical protein